MKILIVSQVPDTKLMGVPRVIHCLADIMRQQGHQVDLMFDDAVPKIWFPRLSLFEWSLRIPSAIQKQVQYLQTQSGNPNDHYDHIVITTMSGWFLSMWRGLFGIHKNTAISSWHHGCELLMWEQMMQEEAEGGHTFSARFKLYYGGLVRWCQTQSLKHQDGSWYCSTEECEWVEAHIPSMKNKTFFIPNGVEPHYYYPERFEKQAATHDTEKIKLLFVGYWDPWRKGRKYLVEAFNQIGKAHPHVSLTLAGVRVAKEDVLSDFDDEVQSQITIIEHLNEPELVQCYQSHDVFVLPSLFEGLPLVLLEAMASGLPVITTNNNGMRDAVRHELDGLLIPRRNTFALVQALSTLINDASLRRQYGKSAYERVTTNFRWLDTAEAGLKALEQTTH